MVKAATKFTRGKKGVYVEVVDEVTAPEGELEDRITHYVAECHRAEYFELRGRAPHLCVWFDTVRDRDGHLMVEEGVWVRG